MRKVIRLTHQISLSDLVWWSFITAKCDEEQCRLKVSSSRSTFSTVCPSDTCWRGGRELYIRTCPEQFRFDVKPLIGQQTLLNNEMSWRNTFKNNKKNTVTEKNTLDEARRKSERRKRRTLEKEERHSWLKAQQSLVLSALNKARNTGT